MQVFSVKVTGDYALFTRPEAKVERVSYPIITPSAARGVLEAILWKPEFRWEILQIEALKQPTFYSIVRNEVSTKATINKRTMENPEDYYTDKYRQLRHSLMLKDVAYIIKAKIHLQPHAKDPIEKYNAMFKRRLEKGQCFHRPYLGTRECAAEFSLPTEEDQTINWTENLGPMFFDFRYPEKGSVTIPYFFNAEVKNGIMKVPSYLYEEVYR
ncbi:type I-C CRISPR-associated protein Cas5c [Oceanobacillus sp. HCA-5259]|uniref:type I-C CRISPR-associated protein Cas5c n=1 Tax=Oceanobacillus sp. HCA-5259 TaxID=3134661 RepID=UPI0030BDCD24